MYSTCLFCNKSLGTNEAIEIFPIGQRLAFDPAKGRLWVVCRNCQRWNLSPLDERWEAIEAAERLYSDTRRRVSTGEIGLARLKDGTDLVRIGEPPRPEFAAWRYGDQFGRRRRRQALIAGGGLAAIGALVAGGVAAGVGIGGFAWMISRAASTVLQGSPDETVAWVAGVNGVHRKVRRKHLSKTILAPSDAGGIMLTLPTDEGTVTVTGHDAHRVATTVLPKVNRYGGTRAEVKNAVAQMETYGGSEAYVASLARVASMLTRPSREKRGRWRIDSSTPTSGLFALSPTQRLAFEMALHEESERRALEGQLAELEAAWREAEEIAAISDDMFLPATVSTALDRMRGRR